MFDNFRVWLKKTFGPEVTQNDIYKDVPKTPTVDGTGHIVHIEVKPEQSKRKSRKKQVQ